MDISSIFVIGLLILVSGLWLLRELPAAIANLLNLGVEAPKDELLCAVAKLPQDIRAIILSYVGHIKITQSLQKDKCFYWTLYQDAFIRHALNTDFFIGVSGQNEHFCLRQMVADILKHIRDNTLDSYLVHKYPLLGDIGLDLKTFHTTHPNQLKTVHWLRNAHLSQVERKYGLPILLRQIFGCKCFDHVSLWVYYLGIRPCMKSGPQASEFQCFFRLSNPEYVGAIMASDSSVQLPDTIQFTEDQPRRIYSFFSSGPSCHCSNEEHKEMYARNNKFIDFNFLTPQFCLPFQAVNLIKHGDAEIIQKQDPSLLREYLDTSVHPRSFSLMFILINICQLPNDDYTAWMALLWNCGISQLEYDTFFGPDRLSEEKNLFIEDSGMRAGTIAASEILYQSCSDIPVWVWYKAVMATTTASQHHPIVDQGMFHNFIAAYRLAKVKKDKSAMELLANRTLVTPEWIRGPKILNVPMDPIFMKGLLEHPMRDCYIKYCFAYSVVHRVTEITELVLHKLLKEYRRGTSAIEHFCRNMLIDGYIPEAYVAVSKTSRRN